ncbi:MAG: VOC family protein [Acidobacteria bacterium]|nr:VOC family protein [Acidobacteriota bacterium]
MASSESKIEPTLTTLLNVRRGAEAIDFYTRAFGATTLSRIDAPDGSVVAQLSTGGGIFWVADESPAHQNFSPEHLGGSTMRMILITDDPHAAFDRAIAAGASSISPVKDESYGWRIGRVVDPFGHHWEIGKPLAGH